MGLKHHYAQLNASSVMLCGRIPNPKSHGGNQIILNFMWIFVRYVTLKMMSLVNALPSSRGCTLKLAASKKAAPETEEGWCV